MYVQYFANDLRVSVCLYHATRVIHMEIMDTM